MNRCRFHPSDLHGQESIGWISISEVFLLCGVLLLAIALVLENRLGESRSETVAAQERLRSIEERNAERERLLVDLTRERDQARQRERLLNDQVAELTRKNGLLVAERQRLERIGAEAAIVKKQLEALRIEAEQSRRLAEEKDRKIDSLQKDLIARSAELTALKQEVAALQLLVDRSRQDAEEKDRKIKELLARGERIVRPLQSAELIVTITCEGLPDDLDLDLYVQNPSNQLCSWNKPRLLTGNQETGILILSEDLRDRAGHREEVFYSSNPLLATSASPYLVFGMIRDVRPRSHRAASPLALPAGLTIGCEVKVRQRDKTEVVAQSVRKPVTKIGDIYIDNGQLLFDKLVTLCGFELSRQPNGLTARPTVVPQTLRGYESATMTPGAQGVDRLR